MKKRTTWVRLVMLLVLASSGIVAGIMACSTGGTSGTPAPDGVKLRDESVTLAAVPAPPPSGRCEPVGGACSISDPDCCINEACDDLTRTCYCSGTTCGTKCTNLQTDPDNCGACGDPCLFGDECCAASCVDEQSDPNNCGGCGHVCTGDSCVGGVCEFPGGWLYTSGNKIYVANGTGGGTQWMARGVNVDDLFLGGGNDPLGSVPDAGGSLRTLIATAITTWKPTFLRVSLAMHTYTTPVSWIAGDAGTYKTPMINVIDSIGSQGVYVLVTLRSDASMIDECTACDDPEATGLPSGSTDAVYRALVDSVAGMAYSNFVIFGVSNEPGGGTLDGGTISLALGHAVEVIRAEEDLQGVPHHLIAVQGKAYTSDLSIYPNSALSSYDNLVYEYHTYTTLATARTDIPVIVGEYGPEAPDAGAPFDAGGFYTNVEANKIPNLAWDLEPFGTTAVKYDLVHNNGSATHLDASTWGKVVQTYLGDPDAY